MTVHELAERARAVVVLSVEIAYVTEDAVCEEGGEREGECSHLARLQTLLPSVKKCKIDIEIPICQLLGMLYPRLVRIKVQRIKNLRVPSIAHGERNEHAPSNQQKDMSVKQ